MNNPLTPYWFYLAGCVAFLIGTIIGMIQIARLAAARRKTPPAWKVEQWLRPL